MSDTYTQYYIEGIKEGREYLNKYPDTDPAEMVSSLKATLAGFSGSSPVGQMLKGERDFWINQIRINQLKRVKK